MRVIQPQVFQLRQLPSPSRQTVAVNQCHPLRKKPSGMWASEWEVEHVRVMGDRWSDSFGGERDLNKFSKRCPRLMRQK
ncbi:hypothetical protein CDAR_128471 [Caerostris darwini]|uniref:Uncharacterized protein n=1 Tax=Caerostris darwini TaxID=1538125 RepID=A0AAV4PD83_9ARAC|nr:hypothetical protein CDAR_128471 [Caerostris darwini]